MFISSLIFVFLDRTKVALDGSQSKEICNPSTVHDRQLPLPEPAGGFLLQKKVLPSHCHQWEGGRLTVGFSLYYCGVFTLI